MAEDDEGRWQDWFAMAELDHQIAHLVFPHVFAVRLDIIEDVSARRTCVLQWTGPTHVKMAMSMLTRRMLPKMR